MAKAKKRGNRWRCLVYIGKDINGKRLYKSFTADSRKEAELLALNFELSQQEKNKTTFEDALQAYIDMKRAVLSPSTIRGYIQLQKNYYSLINDVDLYEIDNVMIQRIINLYAPKLSPKTIYNIHGLISAVFKEYRPDFKLNTTLPQKIKPTYYIPSNKEVQYLIHNMQDEDLLNAVLLSAFGTLRRSEICALTSDDIDGNIICVSKARVINEDKELITKTTKTVESTRYIELPDFVIKRFEGKEGYLVPLHPNHITHRFERTLKRLGLKHFKFHALRHYSASIMHAMGIPDIYIQQRGGWSSDKVLKQIYTHTLDNEQKKVNKKINNYFKKLM